MSPGLFSHDGLLGSKGAKGNDQPIVNSVQHSTHEEVEHDQPIMNSVQQSKH